MNSTPFLTALDSRAAVKGSRDPLGIQALWVAQGRKVIGNLTTVTSNLRDFTLTLLGYHFADRIGAEEGPGHADEIFLKWEQLAAYARFLVNDETGFRGTERVQRNVSEGAKRVRISADSQAQILSDQRTYGLWGLYTVASRSSGFLEGQPDRPSAAARELIESYYLPRLQKEGAGRGAIKVVEILKRQESHLEFKGQDRVVLQAVASILKSPTVEEKAFYRQGLLHGPKDLTDGRQEQLAALVEQTVLDEENPLTPGWLREWSRRARDKGEAWHSLADRLDRIRIADSLLAPASGLFTWLLAFDQVETEAVAARLEAAWGAGLEDLDLEFIRRLKPELEGGDTLPGQRWVDLAVALARGDYSAVIRLLLAQNRAVMKLRGGGAPWIEESQGKLTVRFRDENGDLPDKQALQETLRYPYFIDSLHAMARALR